MAQAKTIPTTSRRSFLAGVAGAVLSTSVAGDAADPIFAAITKYKLAAAEHEHAIKGAAVVKVPPEIEAFVRKACNDECFALENLVATVPTTMAGVMRLLQFQRETWASDTYALEAEHLSYLCESVETALKRIA